MLRANLADEFFFSAMLSAQAAATPPPRSAHLSPLFIHMPSTMPSTALVEIRIVEDMNGDFLPAALQRKAFYCYCAVALEWRVPRR